MLTIRHYVPHYRMLWCIIRYDNNSALRASLSDAFTYHQIGITIRHYVPHHRMLWVLPDMLTIRHYVPHPWSILECIIIVSNSALCASFSGNIQMNYVKLTIVNNSALRASSLDALVGYQIGITIQQSKSAYFNITYSIAFTWYKRTY